MIQPTCLSRKENLSRMRNIDISVIIATRNREQILWETVEKACRAIENKNAEVIVINDGDFPLKVPVFL